MDPELKKELDALRAALGKNVDALARLDALEKIVAAGQADVKLVRAELEKIQQAVTEREQIIRDLREGARLSARQADPIQVRRQAIEMTGMIVRAELARANRMELPAAFRAETDLVRKYQEESLARATLTPMATTGSYVVPTITDLAIQDAVEEVSELLGLVDFIPGLPAGGTFNFTFLSTRPVMQVKRGSTDTAMTASDPVFSQVQLSPAETYVFFPVDNKMFLMSAMALGGYFENLCRDALIDKLAYWLVRGDGTATYNSITGMLAEATAAYIYSLPAGKTAFSDVAATDLQKAKAKCLKRGRGPRGRWILDLEISGSSGLISNMDRLGKVPVVTIGNDGQARILTNPEVIEEHMPGTDESAAGTGFIVYGDPATWIVGMVGGLRIASDASVKFDKNQTAFRGDTIVDIKRKPVASAITIKTAAA